MKSLLTGAMVFGKETINLWQHSRMGAVRTNNWVSLLSFKLQQEAPTRNPIEPVLVGQLSGAKSRVKNG